jgi:hypothetical protein
LEGLSHTSRPSMHCALQFWEGGVLSVTSAGFMDSGVAWGLSLQYEVMLWPLPVPDAN